MRKSIKEWNAEEVTAALAWMMHNEKSLSQDRKDILNRASELLEQAYSCALPEVEYDGTNFVSL